MPTKDEIHLLGINRSGIHAITYWILGHYQDEPVKLRRVSNFNTNHKWTYYLNMSKKQIESERQGKPVDKACLFFTHEDQRLRGACKKIDRMQFQSKKYQGTEFYIDQHENRKIVFILRDPFNHFASITKKHIKKGQTGRDIPPQDKILALWEEYAREALGIKKYLPEDAVFINYNKWFLDQEYRQEISSQLGLEFADRWLNMVTKHGTGSSFDKTRFDGRAQEMNVLNRWEEFKSKKYFRRLFTPAVKEMSEEIFGESPF